jgi:hypothetical protein
MLGKIPLPKGPILDWIKTEYQGKDHNTKQTVVQETADLANKILASYAFYIEGPDSPGPEHRAQFKNDIETYGKRAVELRKFALQSDAPEPADSDVKLMRDAQSSLAARNDETTPTEELLEEPLRRLELSSDAVEYETRETLDDVFNRIDDDRYLMYYTILEQIVDTSIDYAVSEEIEYREFDELEVSLEVAMSRF